MHTATKMAKEKIVSEIKIPAGVKVEIAEGIINVSSGANKVSKAIMSRDLNAEVSGDKVVFSCSTNRKKTRTILGTFEAHLKTMFNGVTTGNIYRLKICSGHFPMSVTISGQELTVKNFLGEKVPRVVHLDAMVKVTTDGNEVVVQGVDLEKVGAVAARIEKATGIKGRDLRVFQDGIYITSKNGKGV